MADLVQQKTSEQLQAAQKAHHAYEAEELEGKRDEQWPAWYADYLVNNGLGELVGKELDVDDLAALLEESNRQFDATGQAGDWAEFVSEYILQSLE